MRPDPCRLVPGGLQVVLFALVPHRQHEDAPVADDFVTGHIARGAEGSDQFARGDRGAGSAKDEWRAAQVQRLWTKAGLCGDEVALPGRILILAEGYDALAEARSYKKAWPMAEIAVMVSSVLFVTSP